MRTTLLFGTVLAAGLAVSGAVPASAAQGPDNGRITFSRYDPATDASTLWVADADGQNQQQLVTGPSTFSDWSPDGTRIAFDYADDTGFHIATITPDGEQRQDAHLGTGCPGDAGLVAGR